MRIQVKLRDGFSDDTVVVTANGEEVYRRQRVTTDLTISFADAFELEVEGPVVRLGVTVVGGSSASREIQVEKTPFVEVWRNGGELELRASAEEVPML